jgi:hypothetical protein
MNMLGAIGIHCGNSLQFLIASSSFLIEEVAQTVLLGVAQPRSKLTEVTRQRT